MALSIADTIRRLFRRRPSAAADERVTTEEIDRVLSGYGTPPETRAAQNGAAQNSGTSRKMLRIGSHPT